MWVVKLWEELGWKALDLGSQDSSMIKNWKVFRPFDHSHKGYLMENGSKDC